MMADHIARGRNLPQAWSTPHPDLESRKQGKGSPQEGHLFLRAVQPGHSTVLQGTMEEYVRYYSIQGAI